MNMINSGHVSALWCYLAFLLGTATISVANANDCLDVTTVEEFDLETYASKPWYVQQQAENLYTPRDYDRCAKAEYTIRETRTFWGYSIDVLNSAETGSGDRGASLCADYDPQRPSELMVAPCWLPKWFAGPYWVVAYNDDTDNGYALVSGGQPRYAVDNDTTCGNDGNEQCCKTGSGINNSGLWYVPKDKGFSLVVVSVHIINEWDQNQKICLSSFLTNTVIHPSIVFLSLSFSHAIRIDLYTPQDFDTSTESE